MSSESLSPGPPSPVDKAGDQMSCGGRPVRWRAHSDSHTDSHADSHTDGHGDHTDAHGDQPEVIGT